MSYSSDDDDDHVYEKRVVDHNMSYTGSPTGHENNVKKVDIMSYSYDDDDHVYEKKVVNERPHTGRSPTGHENNVKKVDVGQPHSPTSSSSTDSENDDEEQQEEEKFTLLPAGVYATIMGRHLVDDHDGSVQFDWPGVRFTFRVKGTTFVSIRIQTAGCVFGYRVYPVTEQGEKLEYGHDDPSAYPEMLLGGGLFAGGKEIKEYALAVDLDPFQYYQVQIWKRDDPSGHVCKIEGLYVDKPDGMGIVDGGHLLNSPRSPPSSPTHSPTSIVEKRRPLNLEFVGNSDTVGFGNMTGMSSILYHTLCQASCLPLFRRLYEGTDVTQSWPAFLSASLDDAHYSVVAWSGVGAKYSMSLQESMTMLYPRLVASDAKSRVKPVDPVDISRSPDKDEMFNESKNKQTDLGPADAVFVYIGQNDQVRLSKDSKASSTNAKLSLGYEELLLLIRRYRAAPTPIIVIVPTLDAAVSGAATEAKRLQICAIQHELWHDLVKNRLGGPVAGFYLVENSHNPAIQLNSPRDFGMNLNWNAASQRKWANGLAPKIGQLLSETVLARQYHTSKNNQNAVENAENKNDDDDDDDVDIIHRGNSFTNALKIADCGTSFCFGEE